MTEEQMERLRKAFELIVERFDPNCDFTRNPIDDSYESNKVHGAYVGYCAAILEATARGEVSEQKLGEYRSGEYTSGEIKAMIAEAFKRGAAYAVSEDIISRYENAWPNVGINWLRDEIKRRGSEGV